jgi:protein TonB
MLEDSLFESQGRGRTRRPFTMVLAGIVHVVTIGALIVIPLLQTQALPLALVSNTSLLLPSLAAPKPVGELVVVQPHADKPVPSTPEALTTPVAIPDKILIVAEAPVPNPGMLPFVGGTGPGIVGPNVGLHDGALELALPVPPVAPPPPPPPPQRKVNVVRTGGIVEPPKLIHRVDPVYPDTARRARVQGVVVMEAVISTDGSVDRLRVISGHLLLNQAALDAVKQWKYKPTLLNGDPVEVIMTITVTFSFQ